MTDLGNGLFAVSVPEDAAEIGFGNHCLGYKTKLQPPSDTNGFTHAKEPQYLFCSWDFEILGTVTKDNISFDVEPYVEILETIDKEYFKEKIYKDYVGDMIYYYSKNKSFRSLLSSKGLFFENPYGSVKPVMSMCANKEECLELREKWQQAQNNLIEKLVIIKRL